MITVRPAREAEAETLRQIAAAAYQHYVPRIGREPAPMTADYRAAVNRGQAWVAVEDGEVAGFVILLAEPGYLLLENVAVLPAAQGRGIGARLLALAEERARALHLNEIRLYTNEAISLAREGETLEMPSWANYYEFMSFRRSGAEPESSSAS